MALPTWFLLLGHQRKLNHCHLWSRLVRESPSFFWCFFSCSVPSLRSWNQGGFRTHPRPLQTCHSSAAICCSWNKRRSCLLRPLEPHSHYFPCPSLGDVIILFFLSLNTPNPFEVLLLLHSNVSLTPKPPPRPLCYTCLSPFRGSGLTAHVTSSERTSWSFPPMGFLSPCWLSVSHNDTSLIPCFSASPLE